MELTSPKEEDLAATEVIDCDSPEIQGKALELFSPQDPDSERAKALFYFVRDKIKYRIALFREIEKERFRASFILRQGFGFCIPKAILLVALNRAIGIPARLCLADIRVPRISSAFKELAGTDIMAFHGYAEMFVAGRWVKADPAFDIDLCRQKHFIPVDFSGDEDALFRPFDLQGRPHIEYLNYRGSFADLPHDLLIAGLREFYGNVDEAKIAKWTGENW